MKVKILTLCVAILLVVCVVLSALVLNKEDTSATQPEESQSGANEDIIEKLNSVYDSFYEKIYSSEQLPETEPLPAANTTTDTQFKIALLHLYSESKDIVLILPFTSVQVTEGALLKAFMSSNTSVNEALVYIDRYADRTLNSAYGTMDEIVSKFKSILDKYNISATSAYTAKYNKLVVIFESLRNTSTELLSRARTLIKMSKSEDYDTYYTNYVEQLSDITSKIEQYCDIIIDEYYALLASLSNDYDLLVE